MKNDTKADNVHINDKGFRMKPNLKKKIGVGSQVRKNKIEFLTSNKISEIQHKKYLALYNSLQSDWLTWADRNEVRSKISKMNFSISPSQLCSHTPSSLNAGAKRRAIWPCLNVATWRRERSDRAIQQI